LKNKTKILAIIIICCVILLAVFLVFSFSKNTPPENLPDNNNNNSSNTSPTNNPVVPTNNKAPLVKAISENVNPCAWYTQPLAAPGVSIKLSWNFQDPNNDSQSGYEIWVDANSSFSSVYKFNNLIEGYTLKGPNFSYLLDLKDDKEKDWLEKLSFGNKYYWKVRAKDQYGTWSEWSETRSFFLPSKPYPAVNINYLPKPSIYKKETKFYDYSMCPVSNAQFQPCKNTGAEYLWVFGDGTTSNKKGDLTHLYPKTGSYKFTLTIKDGVNACKITRTIGVINAPTK